VLERRHALGVRVAARSLLKTIVHGLILTSFELGLVLIIIIVIFGPFRLMVLASGPGAAVVFVLGLLSIGAFFVLGTGIANSLLASWLWFPVRRGVLSYLVSGVVLHSTAVASLILLPLLVVGGLLESMGSATGPGLLVAIFVIDSLVYGYFGREIARIWEIGRPRASTPGPPLQPINPRNLQCPRCRGVRLVVAEDQSAFCIDCNHGILPEAFAATRA
jgi:hypothetical protein